MNGEFLRTKNPSVKVYVSSKIGSKTKVSYVRYCLSYIILQSSIEMTVNHPFYCLVNHSP